MLIDLHVHSHLSQRGSLEPEEIILKAKRVGLDGICFAEDKPFKEWKDLQKLGQEHEVAVFVGRLVSTQHGDFLYIPADAKRVAANSLVSTPDGSVPTFADLRAAIAPDDGLLIAAHPYKPSEENPLGDRIFRMEGLDGIQVRNGSCDPLVNDFALEASFHLRSVCIGGSQTCESLATIGKAATMLLQPVATQQELIDGLRSGSVWPVEMADEITLRPTPDHAGRSSRGGDRGGRSSDRGGRSNDRGGRSSDRGGRSSDRGGRSSDRGGHSSDRGGRSSRPPRRDSRR